MLTKKELLMGFTGSNKELHEYSIETASETLIALDTNNAFDHDLYHQLELICTQGVRATPEMELDLQFILQDGLIPEEEREGIHYIQDNYFEFIKILPLKIVFSNDLRFYILDWLDGLEKDGIITEFTANNIDFDLVYPKELR